MKKWGTWLSVLIIAGMIAIIVFSNLEIKNSKKESNGYESAMIEDLPEDEIMNLPDDWMEAELADETGLAVGDTAPDFELETLDGKKVRLSDYQGKTVMLNFWASWCPPCRSEMPHMQTYYTEQRDPSAMEILAVNMTDTEVKKEVSAKEFAKEYKLTFPILLDRDGALKKTYQIRAYPTTYIINAKGVITDVVIAPIDDKFLKKLIDGSK